MKRKVFSCMMALIMLFCCATYPVCAATPEELAPLSSAYISSYTTSITRSSGSNIFYVNFSISGTGLMDKIGATEIVVYRSPNMSQWFEYATYSSSDYPSMLISSKAGYAEDVAVTGTYGYYFKAKVTVYAEKNGGSDSREIYTNSLYLTSSG